MAHAKAYEGMRDEHANLHAHHAAISEIHEKAGQKDLAHLHHRMAGHHLKLAEHADALAGPGAVATAASGATEGTKATPATKPTHGAAAAKEMRGMEVDALAMGAANQLHRKGHIDAKTHARIHREARRPRPFGSLGGSAGHYMGDVDAENSGGTNSVA